MTVLSWLRYALSRLLTGLAVVAAVLVLVVSAWVHHFSGPIRAQMRLEAVDLQRRVVQLRAGDPAATGPAAEQALIRTTAAREQVHVLGADTGADGRLWVEVSLWAALDNPRFSLDSPTSAMTCLHVTVTPGRADNRAGERGRVAVRWFRCPAHVPLRSGSTVTPALQIHQVRVDLPPWDVPAIITPCYSGSGTCN
jgi:hypothetical protein